MSRLLSYILAAGVGWTVLLFPSCKAVSSFIHDGEVVAKLGKHRLYLSELESMIPNGTTPEDSANLANLYIHSWANDMAFLDVAQKHLSKEEKDVSKDLEAYKRSLLRYRFEQHYVNERLDTAVTTAQVEEYYEAHKEKFKLERPVLRARFLNIAKDSPNLAPIKRLMSSDNVEDVMAADSIAFNSTQRYHDYSASWIDAVVLAAEFGVDYAEMLSRKRGPFIEMEDGESNVSVAYIVEMMDAGEIAPLDFCKARIKDIVISGRKHELLVTLEQDLIEEAKVNEDFVIYSK